MIWACALFPLKYMYFELRIFDSVVYFRPSSDSYPFLFSLFFASSFQEVTWHFLHGMLSLQIVNFVGGKISVPVWCFFQETCLQFTFRETSGTHQPDAKMSMLLKCKRIDHRLCKLFRIFPIASLLPYKQRTESLVDSWSSRHIGVYMSVNFPLLPPFSTQNIDLFVKVSRMNLAFLSLFFFFFLGMFQWFRIVIQAISPTLHPNCPLELCDARRHLIAIVYS